MPTVDSTFINANKIDEIENSTEVHSKKPKAVTFEERSRFQQSKNLGFSFSNLILN